MKPTKKPEIMSPAGYWPQLYAAIEAGADSVYFGLTHFSARAKVGFLIEELPEVMRTLHKRGVKGFVTFNTLVFDHELQEAAKTLATIASAGADAIIVQDVGIARLAQKIAPDLVRHGSTQMSITNAEGIQLAQQFGLTRVVLARELSLAEIKSIGQNTDCELEIFVHGALCVSYSGQCFSSEAWGGRSANRGQCAQVCRLSYEMIVDQQLKPLGEARYLLSPGDLYALHQLPEILETGVSSLKIEGRYKDENYVALVTQAYRKALDDAWEKRPIRIDPQEEIQIEQVYSRGFGPHFLTGTNHQKVVTGRSPRHRGVLMGTVARVLKDSIWIKPEPKKEASLKPGDGVVFDAANWRSPDQSEEGGHIYQIIPLPKGLWELYFGNGEIRFDRIREGDWIWRTFDPEIQKIARPWTQANQPVAKQPIKICVTAEEGKPLSLEWKLISSSDLQIRVQSEDPLAVAQNHALTEEYLFKQLGRLGETPYELTEIELYQKGNPFAPSSLLNHLRREAVQLLQKRQAETVMPLVHEPEIILSQLIEQSKRDEDKEKFSTAQIHLLVRTPEQLNAAISLKPASITLDYLDLYGLQPAVEAIKKNQILPRVASPRILKPGEERILHFLMTLKCPILVRSNGLLMALQQQEHPPLIGDFSLNVANVLSADIFLKLQLLRLTPTHDLNAEQIVSLAKRLDAKNLEVIAYQHLPVFHMEHCVFSRFLSTGTSYKDCGHPCEKHRVELKDKEGREHPVMADVGCRNTVFGAEAQEASSYLERWQKTGIVHFRLEFVHESATQVTQITQAFADTLCGKQDTSTLKKQLQKWLPQGTTEGSLFI